jgi:tetratricopeptide (TPR) repeat protein
VLEPRAYGIPLRPLPTADSLAFMEPIQVPPAIDGIVFISAGVLSGFEFGPDRLNPYAQFRSLRPVSVIDHSVFVYEGHFEIPLASALGRVLGATALLQQGQLDAALTDAETAVRLAPDSVSTQAALGDVLTALGRKEEARTAYDRALRLAQTIEPEFQKGWVPTLQERIAAR